MPDKTVLQYNTNQNFMGIAVYECEVAYYPNGGPVAVICQADGTWSNTTFYCD